MATDDGSGFSVTRTGLAAAGTAAKTASGLVDSATEARLTGATPGVISAHRGWQSSAALQACLEAWETRLRQLSTEIKQISRNLNDTADGYDEAEEQTVTDIQHLAAGLDGKSS